MKHTFAAAAFIVAWPLCGSAQSPSTTLRLDAGVSWTVRRDLSASPLAFGGLGADAAVTLERDLERTSLQLFLRDSERHMSSAATPPASERVMQTQAGAGFLRRLNHPESGIGELRLGLMIESSLALTTHHYADPTHRVSSFVFHATTMGPVVAWRKAMLDGYLRAQLSTPIVGVVVHSYSVVNEEGDATTRRVVTPAALRELSGSVSFAPVTTRRLGVIYTYRIDASRYDDIQSVRSASQSVTIGAVLELGRTP